jgi:hypothetical protein
MRSTADMTGPAVGSTRSRLTQGGLNQKNLVFVQLRPARTDISPRQGRFFEERAGNFVKQNQYLMRFGTKWLLSAAIDKPMSPAIY